MEELFRYTDKDFQDLTMEDWLSDKATALQPIAVKWFNEIKSCGDDVQGIFHDGYPQGCVSKTPFAYVNIFKAHVNVGFFYGAYLPDRQGLLEGSGKRMRHIKLKPEASHDDAEIKTLIKDSYLDIKRRLHAG